MSGGTHRQGNRWHLLLVLILLSVSGAQTLETREDKQTLQSTAKTEPLCFCILGGGGALLIFNRLSHHCDLNGLNDVRLPVSPPSAPCSSALFYPADTHK